MNGWSAQDIQKYGKLADGLKDIAATQQKALPWDYGYGAVSSDVLQYTILDLLTDGIMPEANMASKLSNTGKLEKYLPLLTSSSYEMLQKSSQPNYEQKNYAMDWLNSVVSSLTGKVGEDILNKYLKKYLPPWLVQYIMTTTTTINDKANEQK